MKVKTSVTLSSDLLDELDKLSGRSKNRSALVERALRHYLRAVSKDERDRRDRALYEQHEDELSREALDALSYQVDL